MSEPIHVYTDGGARPNPGPGGWGAVILDPAADGPRELSGGTDHTTNNRMEMTAAIEALATLPAGSEVVLHTDSRYLRQGITSWLARWMRNGFRTAAGDAVKNDDLWRRLAETEAAHRVDWRWLKGHAGHEHNERADALASAEIEARTGAGGSGASAAGHQEPVEGLEALIKVRAARGRGAWAVLLLDESRQDLLLERADGASANRLELMAGLAALDAVPSDEPLTLTCGDYLRRGATEWLEGWRQRRWQTGSGDPVKNDDLWRRVARLQAGRELSWRRFDAKSPEAKELERRLKAAMKR